MPKDDQQQNPAGAEGEQQEQQGQQEQNGQPAAPPAGEQEQQESGDAGANEGDLGFPLNTAVAEMEPEQAIAYWRHEKSKQQRKFEQTEREKKALELKVEELRLAGLSAEQRAAEEAVAKAKQEARVEARTELLPTLVVAELRARGLTAEDAAERVEFLDLSKLVDDSGVLVADRLDRLAPPAPPAPAGPSPQQVFHQAGGAPQGQRTSLSADAVRTRADQIKNKTKQ